MSDLADLPPLPPEHRRPTMEEFMAADYPADSYDSQMESWERGIRERMAGGLSYRQAAGLPEEPAAEPEALPKPAAPKKPRTRPSFAYPGYHEKY